MNVVLCTRQDQVSWVNGVCEAIRWSTSISSDSSKSAALASRLLFNSSEELLNNNLNKPAGGGGIPAPTPSTPGDQQQAMSSGNQVTSQQHNRSNALSHVCWHRNISINAAEIVDKEAVRICVIMIIITVASNTTLWL